MVTLPLNCLYFIKDESPLIFAFDMLLNPRLGIKAVKSNAENIQDLIDEACELKPEVIVLEDAAIETKENVLANLLASSSAKKIVVVLRESNYIYTFKKEEILLASSSDFFEAIQVDVQVQNEGEKSNRK